MQSLTLLVDQCLSGMIIVVINPNTDINQTRFHSTWAQVQPGRRSLLYQPDRIHQLGTALSLSLILLEPFWAIRRLAIWPQETNMCETYLYAFNGRLLTIDRANRLRI